MTPSERRRLVGVLGLLSSEHDGERAAAGLLATRLLKSANVTWEQLLSDNAPARLASAQPRPGLGWRIEVAFCQRHPTLLTPWEQRFINSLVACVSLSQKQQAVLSKIARVVREKSVNER